MPSAASYLFVSVLRAYVLATSLTSIFREHIWARSSVVSTFILLAKSKNGAVLGREAALRSMDSHFAGADVTGLDELRSLVENIVIM